MPYKPYKPFQEMLMGVIFCGPHQSLSSFLPLLLSPSPTLHPTNPHSQILHPRARSSAIAIAVCSPLARGSPPPFPAALVTALQPPPRAPVPARRLKAPSPSRSLATARPHPRPYLSSSTSSGDGRRWERRLPGLPLAAWSCRRLRFVLSSGFLRSCRPWSPREAWQRWISTPRRISLI
jgi:hypothetical protein